MLMLHVSSVQIIAARIFREDQHKDMDFSTRFLSNIVLTATNSPNHSHHFPTTVVRNYHGFALLANITNHPMCIHASISFSLHSCGLCLSTAPSRFKMPRSPRRWESFGIVLRCFKPACFLHTQDQNLGANRFAERYRTCLIAA